MSSMSWKGTEKWSINQPQSSLAYFQNIPEVQALVALSPHPDQKIIASKACEHYVTGLCLQCGNHGVQNLFSSYIVSLELGRALCKERDQISVDAAYITEEPLSSNSRRI